MRTLRSLIKDPGLLNRLVALDDVMEKFLRYWQAHAPHFTDHGKRHCDGIEGFIGELLPDKTKDELDEYETFLLVCGILTHDIGMMYGLEGRTNQEIRENHHIYSRMIIKDPKMLPVNLNEAEREIVGELAYSHRDRTDINDLLEKFPVSYQGPQGVPRTILVRPRFLAGLLRLGDACDIAHSRTVEEYIAQVIKFNSEAKAYHDCHRRITAIVSNEEDAVIEVWGRVTSNEDERILRAIVVRQLEREFESVRRILAKYDGKYMEVVFKPIPTTGSRNDVLHVPTEIINRIGQRLALDEWADKLSWERLFELCHKQTERLLETMKIDKYDSNLYEPRRIIEGKLDQFISGEKSLFLLIGDSGIGKTNVLCHLAQKYLKEGCPVLFYSGAMIPGSDIRPLVRSDLKINLEAEQILERADELAQKNNKHLVILLDGLNENQHPETLLRHVNDLISRNDAGRIKAVVSCRTTIWEWLLSTVGVDLFWKCVYGTDEERAVYLQQFDSEELSRVYGRYKIKYKLQTDYEALSRKTKEKLKVPLMVKFVSKIYQNKEIPIHTPTSLVFQDYYKSFIFDAARGTGDIGKRLFLQEVVKEMYRKKTDRLPLDELWEHKRVGPDMREVDLGSNFLRLRDEGIVYIDKENDELRFTYDQFFEFLLGKLISEKKPSLQDYLTLANKAKGYHSLWNALTSSLIMCWDPGLLESLAKSNDYRATWLVRDVLVRMATEENEKSYELLRKFTKSRSSILRRIGVDVAYDLRDSVLLEEASVDKSTKIRAAAIQYIYYLWKTNTENIFDTLERMSKKLRRRWLPTRWLEPFIQLSLIIYAEQFRDENRFKNRKESVNRLNKMWKKVLDEVLYLRKGRFAITDQIKSRARNLAMAMGVKLVVRAMRSQPNYSPFNLEEIRAFMKLPESKKERLFDLIPYATFENRKAQDIVPEILTLAKSNNEVIAAQLGFVLLSQSKNNLDEVLVLIEELFREISGVFIGRLAWVLGCLSVVQSQYREAILELCEKMTRVVFDESRGWFKSGIGRKYMSTLLSTYASLYVKNHEAAKIPLVEHYLEEAIQDDDFELFSSVLHNLKHLAIHFGYCTEALNLLKPLLKKRLENRQNQVFSQILASIRGFYPRQVQLFLEQEESATELRERVRQLLIRKDVGEVFTETLVGTFGGATYFSPLHGRNTVEGIAALARYDKVTEWIAEHLIPVTINLIYGESVLTIGRR